MEKIVIVHGPEGPDADLLDWLGVVFPECEIEIKSKAASGNQASTVPACDRRGPYIDLSSDAPSAPDRILIGP
jgi:hypothetical protein